MANEPEMSIREDLKAFLDNELSPERAAEVSAAIDNDPTLREEYQFMKILSGEIKDAAQEPQIKGLDRALDKTTKVREWPPYLRVGGLVAGGVTSLFLIGLVGATLFPLFSQAKIASPEAAMLSRNRQADIAADAAKAASPPSEPMAGKPESEAPMVNGASSEGGSSPKSSVKPREKMPQNHGSVVSPELSQPLSKAKAPMSRRSVVRNADMGIKVKDVRQAVAESERQVEALGGFVESTNFNESQDSAAATMAFQVPEGKFSASLDYLRKLGTVSREQIGGQDVTAEVASTDGQISALADEEYNLIQELQRARNMETRLEIRSRLSSVRQEMSSLKQQNKVLKDLANMSRMSVTFEKSGQLDEAKPGDWFGQTTKGAAELLGFFGRFVGVGVIYLLFLAPIWLPIGGIVWWIRRKKV